MPIIRITRWWDGTTLHEVEAVDQKAALVALAATGADLTDVTLRGADLTDVTLTNAHLRGAALRGATLIGADLRGADLRGATLTDADLRGATLTGADLRGADLTDVTLRGADLTNADLTAANLTNADLRGAHLGGATLTGADFTGADLTNADLRGAHNLRLPTGETWEEYLTETVPALLTAGGKPLESFAEHFTCHTWENCPIAHAFDVRDLSGVPLLLRPRAQQFVQLFDAGQIPWPLPMKAAATTARA